MIRSVAQNTARTNSSGTNVLDGVPRQWVDTAIRIDGELRPANVSIYREDSGNASGEIYTCVKTGEVFHRPIGGELQRGLPVPNLENAVRHRTICKAIRGKTGDFIIDEAADFPTTAEEWTEIDAADGVTYDAPDAADVTHGPAPLTDSGLCRRASIEMLRSLWGCLASIFRNAA